MDKRILVIGYGNTMRGDDGFGRYVIACLLQEEFGDNVTIIERHQLGLELAEDLSATDFVIFLDIHCSNTVGEQMCKRIAVDNTIPITFSHHLTPGTLLACTQAIYGIMPQAILISIGSNLFDHGSHLSPTVAALVEPAADLARTLIFYITDECKLPANL